VHWLQSSHAVSISAAEDHTDSAPAGFTHAKTIASIQNPVRGELEHDRVDLRMNCSMTHLTRICRGAVEVAIRYTKNTERQDRIFDFRESTGAGAASHMAGSTGACQVAPIPRFGSRGRFGPPRPEDGQYAGGGIHGGWEAQVATFLGMRQKTRNLDKSRSRTHHYLLMRSPTEFSTRVRACAHRMAESGVAALGGLFDLTSRRLVRYASTLTRNQHDAEDAVQTALTKVASQPKLLCRADQPWSYLLRMVRNEALLACRKRRRLSFRGDLSDLLTLCRVDELEQEETHRAVWSALRRLPTAQAEVVVLKIWEDMTFAQIAEILEVKPDTAASRYRYAMQRLSRSLASRHREVPNA